MGSIETGNSFAGGFKFCLRTATILSLHRGQTSLVKSSVRIGRGNIPQIKQTASPANIVTHPSRKSVPPHSIIVRKIFATKNTAAGLQGECRRPRATVRLVSQDLRMGDPRFRTNSNCSVAYAPHRLEPKSIKMKRARATTTGTRTPCAGHTFSPLNVSDEALYHLCGVGANATDGTLVRTFSLYLTHGVRISQVIHYNSLDFTGILCFHQFHA